ncbi:MAG: RNA binding S1 protein [uncultured bacterium (gcode 4)]|uniref:RNA binding S1 protein n=1 Tax=uncultured bacterium (gcode 4) TaxID=1234023 RepID=K2FEC8_9BACT|nr:MAG: RNA binding S1 protein [uncultured bacterium (gcode 4)]
MSEITTILPIPNYIEIISKTLNLKKFQVETVLDFTLEGATVPFIARYRKERTGNLDENDIRSIIELNAKEENLHKAKQTAINWIEELGKMTPELMKNIIEAKTLKEVEDIYKPYKSKKKTKAMVAIEKWFQVVADSIKKNLLSIPEELIWKYPEEEIVEWAIEIIGAEVSANATLRHSLIWMLENSWNISASKKSEKMLEKLNQKDKDQVPKFTLYFDFSLKISRIKPYQILALNRWENLWILNVKIEKSEEISEEVKNKYANILGIRQWFIAPLEQWFKIWYEALFWSVENELRWDLSEIWEDDSIKTFQSNLQALLMTKPEYGKTILAIDPGYRAGCKICIIDELGNPISFDKIYLHEKENFLMKLTAIFKKNKIDAVVVGNWTWCDETCELVSGVFAWDVIVVNESGASVYSASAVAQEEFPDLDSLDRWTVSIWRRYIDPLSELVKVPVWSIWVWMYQHDISEKKLSEKLWYVVEDVVNEVGINVNNASIHVLGHISWIDKREAKKIYNHRPYKSREALKKVLSEKAYKLAIWFLRVPDSKEKFDNTDIHPDQYELAKFVLENGVNNTNFRSYEKFMKEIYEDVNSDTVAFIHKSNEISWSEKRINSSHTKARKKVAMEDIKDGDIFDWVVRNVVAFGAFVDIWLKNDWLVHVSQMADRFVSNPQEIVSVGDKVKVKITWIDKTTGKIQLSMKGM